jgi:hypothetical protein
LLFHAGVNSYVLIESSGFLLAQRSTDPVKVLQDFPVRSKHAGLVIGDGMGLAEGFDDFLRFSQFVPGHVREQVMLDLVVESAVPEVGKRVGFHVSGGEHLAAQKVQSAVLV